MTQRPKRNNFVTVPRAPFVPEFKPCKAAKFCLLNATILNDFVIENKIDIMAFIETWLLPGDMDGAVISDITPTGYFFRHASRERRAVLCKKSFNVKMNSTTRYQSFEYIDIMLLRHLDLWLSIIHHLQEQMALLTTYFSRSLKPFLNTWRLTRTR